MIAAGRDGLAIRQIRTNKAAAHGFDNAPALAPAEGSHLMPIAKQSGNKIRSQKPCRTR